MCKVNTPSETAVFYFDPQVCELRVLTLLRRAFAAARLRIIPNYRTHAFNREVFPILRNVMLEGKISFIHNTIERT